VLGEGKDGGWFLTGVLVGSSTRKMKGKRRPDGNQERFFIPIGGGLTDLREAGSPSDVT